MDSPQVFIAFGAIMLVVALLAVLIDWFGKPLRHRKFVPKMYRFPDERQPRRSKVRATEWSDASMVLPVIDGPTPERLVRYPSPSALGPGNGDGQFPPGALNGLALDAGPPTAQVPVVPLDGPPPGLVTVADTDPDAALDLDADEPTAAPDPVEVTPEPLLAADDAASSDPAPGDTAEAAEAEPDTTEAAEAEPDTTEAAEAEPDTGEAAEAEPTTADTGEAAEAEPDTADTGEAAEADGPGHRLDRKRGWRPGGYVFNLTADGNEPSPATVRTRYWKNVAATAGASIFGSANLDRMQRGKPPRRRNHRSGKLEPMKLPAVSFTDNDGQTPVPTWPDGETDPFAPAADQLGLVEPIVPAEASTADA